MIILEASMRGFNVLRILIIAQKNWESLNFAQGNHDTILFVDIFFRNRSCNRFVSFTVTVFD